MLERGGSWIIISCGKRPVEIQKESSEATMFSSGCMGSSELASKTRHPILIKHRTNKTSLVLYLQQHFGTIRPFHQVPPVKSDFWTKNFWNSSSKSASLVFRNKHLIKQSIKSGDPRGSGCPSELNSCKSSSGRCSVCIEATYLSPPTFSSSFSFSNFLSASNSHKCPHHSRFEQALSSSARL